MSSGGVSKNRILKQAFSEEGVDIKVLVDEQQRIIQAQRAQLARLNNMDQKRKVMRDLLAEIGEALIVADMTRADPMMNEHGDARMVEMYSGAWVRYSLIQHRDLIKRIEAARASTNVGGAEKGGRGA